MAIRPVLIDKQSPFVGESCALCKEPFNPGEEIIICPQDATRHHVHCWRANGDRCTAYGCSGRGSPIGRTPPPPEPEARPETNEERPGRSKVRTLPTAHYSCAHSCLILSLAITILLVGIGCFGLWAILDYLMLEVWEYDYRGMLPDLFGLALIQVASGKSQPHSFTYHSPYNFFDTNFHQLNRL